MARHGRKTAPEEPLTLEHADSPLVVSVAGVRGIAGASLSPAVVARYVSAYAQTLKPGRVIVGGDSRASRSWITPIVIGALVAHGHAPVEVDLAPTPTFGILVRELKASGAVAITASHNPSPWNGLKFFGPRGRFLTPDEFAAMKARLDRPAKAPKAFALGEALAAGAVFSRHRELIARALPPKRGRTRVVIDACNGAGSDFLPAIAKEHGAIPVVINADPSKPFPRLAEPLPEALGALCARVKKERAAVGFALDPDADRLALVDEKGCAIGEERTLTLAADAYLRLAKKKGPIVANLSTTRALDDVAAMHGVAVHRSKVGEAHVVALMESVRAVIGGEGNGGVILPTVHPGRDAATGIALILAGLRERGGTLSEWNASIPGYAMVKDKADIAGNDVAAVLERVRAAFSDAQFDTQDGLKATWADRWLHVRPSGTEPIVRFIAEAPTQLAAEALVAKARKALA